MSPYSGTQTHSEVEDHLLLPSRTIWKKQMIINNTSNEFILYDDTKDKNKVKIASEVIRVLVIIKIPVLSPVSAIVPHCRRVSSFFLSVSSLIAIRTRM